MTPKSVLAGLALLASGCTPYALRTECSQSYDYQGVVSRAVMEVTLNTRGDTMESRLYVGDMAGKAVSFFAYRGMGSYSALVAVDSNARDGLVLDSNSVFFHTRKLSDFLYANREPRGTTIRKTLDLRFRELAQRCPIEK